MTDQVFSATAMLQNAVPTTIRLDTGSEPTIETGPKLPKMDLTPLFIAVFVVELVAPPVMLWLGGWRFLPQAILMWSTLCLYVIPAYIFWRWKSSQTGTVAYDMRHGSQTAAPAKETPRPTPDGPMHGPWLEEVDYDAVQAALIIEAVQASGDPFARPTHEVLRPTGRPAGPWEFSVGSGSWYIQPWDDFLRRQQNAINFAREDGATWTVTPWDGKYHP